MLQSTCFIPEATGGLTALFAFFRRVARFDPSEFDVCLAERFVYQPPALGEGHVGRLARFAKCTSPVSVYLKAYVPYLRFRQDLGLLLCLPSGDPCGCRSAECADSRSDDSAKKSCKSCVHGVSLWDAGRPLPGRRRFRAVGTDTQPGRPRSPLDGRFPDLFDAVLNDAGVGVVLGGVEMPRMNVGTDLPA